MSKRKISTAVLLFSIVMCGSAAAGPVNISNQTIDHERTWFGPTSVQGTTAKGALRIVGPTNFKGSKFRSNVSVVGPFHSTASRYRSQVSVTGPATTKTSVFQSKVSVIGPFNSMRSEFKKLVSVTGPVSASKTEFGGLKINGGSNKLSNRTTAEHVTIRYTGKKSGRPYLCLDGKTQVASVTFSGVKGRVYLEDRRSSVTGRVRNGKTIRGRCPED
ncbi:hypothetical protein [Pseudovibrio japonicus]|uniref:hypothetical protein n=1 Tax=Pseudovibrio japonicus TaxID=366534 RepID=UPI00167975C9|nr:hypothetical protein [Pseudovibrio japonicus]